MRRWTIRILVGLCGLIVVTALTGATYQWLATRKDLAATPPPGQLVDIGGHRLHLWCTGTARLPSSSTRASAARVLTGASSNLMLLDSRVSAPTTGQVWVTAIPARRRGPHAASRASWPNSSPAAASADRWCSSGPPSRVSMSACSLPITRAAAGLVLVDASHEDQAHEVPPDGAICSSAVDDRRPPTVRRVVRPENRIAGSISAAIRAGDEFPRSRIPGGG